MWFATSPTPFSVGAHLKATRISIHSILVSSASERWHGKSKVLSLIFINRAGESSEETKSQDFQISIQISTSASTQTKASL